MEANTPPTLEEMCETIRHRYSACDVADALLKLHVESAGFCPDILPLQSIDSRGGRIVAPISTAVLVPKSWDYASPMPPQLPTSPNIPKGLNWTDCPEPGTIVIVQQPKEHISAILGDIMATRLRYRGVVGVVADGRIRDVKSCAEICNKGNFQIWSRGISAAGPSLEAIPWAVNVPLQIGDKWVNPGDILCADEEDQAIVIIPRGQLRAVFDLLPVLKKASDAVLALVQNGLSLPEAVLQHPEFYSNYKAGAS